MAMQAIAAEFGSTQPRFVNAPEPSAPARGEVVCRTLELGICGTDREILLSAKPWTPIDDTHLILGHECIARVETVGDEVSSVRPGDLVLPVVRRPLPGHTRRVDLLPSARLSNAASFASTAFLSRDGSTAPNTC
jgi:glucose 1-dehydrogenase